MDGYGPSLTKRIVAVNGFCWDWVPVTSGMPQHGAPVVSSLCQMSWLYTLSKMCNLNWFANDALILNSVL